MRGCSAGGEKDVTGCRFDFEPERWGELGARM